MANRKVEVELILDARNYLAEDARVVAATKATENALDDMGDSSDEAAFKLDELGKSTKVSAEQIHNATLKVREAEAAMKALDARIAATKLSVRDLGIEFAKTGDDSIGKEMDSQKSLLGRLTRLRVEVAATHKEFDSLLHSLDAGNTRGGLLGWLANMVSAAGAAGATAGKAFSGGLESALGALGPGKSILYGTLIAAAVAAAPAIGAMIGGAVAGGIGTVGVAAGVFAASRDPGVKAAFADLADTAKKEFFSIGDAFIGPVLHSVEILKGALKDVDIGDTFSKAAPYVEVIATGLANLVRNIMPGLNRTMERLGPFADAAAEGFGVLGTSIGGFLDDVTASKGAVKGLETAFRLVAGTITVVGKTIYALSEAFDWLLEKEDALFSWAADLNIPGFDGFLDRTRDTIKNLGDVPDAAGPAGNAASRFGDDVEGAGEKLKPFNEELAATKRLADELDRSITELFDVQMSMDEATLQWQQDILTLNEAVKEHGTSIKTNTKEGLDNRQMVQGLIKDALNARDVTYEQTKSVDKANEAYRRQIDALKETLRHLGFTEDKIKEMVGDYEINVNVNVRMKQTGTSSVQLKNLDLEDRLDGKRAAGGPVGPGAYLVGDGGRPEILQMGAGQNGYVYPSVQSWQSANAPSGGWAAASGGQAAPSTVRHIVDLQIEGRTVRSILITDALNRNQSQTVVAAAYP